MKGEIGRGEKAYKHITHGALSRYFLDFGEFKNLEKMRYLNQFKFHKVLCETKKIEREISFDYILK